MNIFRKKNLPENIAEDVSPKKQSEKRWDILLRITSVLLAVLIWFWVVGFQSQITTRKFSNISVHIENFNTLSSNGYSILGNRDFYIDVTLEGKNSDLNRINSSEIYASIDLQDIEQIGEVPLPVQIKDMNNVTVFEQSHSSITLYIDRRIQREVAVTGEIVKISTETGTEVDELIFTPEMVTVSGPEQLVNTISHAQIYVDLGVNTIERSRNLKCDFILIDKKGDEVTNRFITTNVNTIDVYVPVYITKDVPLRVNYKYGYYDGNNNVNVKVTPEKIRLKGSPDYLNDLEEIIIETIDEKQHESDRTFTRPILLPGDTENLSEVTSAEIALTFTDMITKNLTIPVSRFRVTSPKDFEYHIQEENLNIRLFGPANRINSITQNSVMISVDLSNLTERDTYPVTVDAVVTANRTGVFCVGEYKLNVEIY